MILNRIWIVLSAFCLFACSQAIEVPPPSIQTTAAPDFTFDLIQGGQMNHQELRGKWIVLNIWATWCPPCVREIPDLIALQAEFAEKNVQFVGISVDNQGTEEILSFSQRVGFNYPILLADINAVSSKFGKIDAIPTTFIIDPNWNLVNRHTGMLSKEALKAELKKWISSTKN